jgi:hypothetical protein
VSTNFVLAQKWKKWANLFTFTLNFIFKEPFKSGKEFRLIFPFKDIKSIVFSQNLSILKKSYYECTFFRVGGSTYYKLPSLEQQQQKNTHLFYDEKKDW